MAKFLFTVIPAFGHVNPTLPVAVELKKRGHEVGYATGSDLKFPIESEGLNFFAAGPSGLKTGMTETAQKMLSHKGMICNYYFFKMIAEADSKTVGELRAVVERYKPDVLVVDSITYAGAQIAEFLGLPWATSSALAGMIPSRDAPPFTSWGLPPSENPVVKSIYSVVRCGQRIVLRFFDRDFNLIRSSLSLPPARNCVSQSALSPYLILIPTCEGFEYKRSDWPPQAHLIGHSPWGKSIDANEDFRWIDSLSDDKPLVYASLGTVHVFRSLDFYRIVIEALRKEPYQVVMSVGSGIDLSEFRGLPDNFRVERFVPHAKLFPRTSAVIHHGGLGIAHDCICNRIPQVVVPIAQDSGEWARRCTAAGIALKIPYPRLNPERLRVAVNKILTDKTIQENIKNLQKVFLSKDAGRTGATLLEKLAETKAPVYRA
jgi:MGT family glycosyltransferase